MTVYVDASVLLRLVLGQAGRFRQWRRVTTAVASMIVEVECLRTLDRLRTAEGLEDEVALEDADDVILGLAEGRGEWFGRGR